MVNIGRRVCARAQKSLGPVTLCRAAYDTVLSATSGQPDQNHHNLGEEPICHS
nr:MAG TPA: hypothetical protein [Caudoviricetes sp.]